MHEFTIARSRICAAATSVCSSGRSSMKALWTRDALHRHGGSVLFPLESAGQVLLPCAHPMCR